MDDELLALLAEQADQIAKLAAELALASDENDTLVVENAKLTHELDAALDKVTDLEGDNGPDYWSGVYGEIRAAWDAWALVELGTSSPSPLDLTGRPELARLWEAVR